MSAERINYFKSLSGKELVYYSFKPKKGKPFIAICPTLEECKQDVAMMQNAEMRLKSERR